MLGDRRWCLKKKKTSHLWTCPHNASKPRDGFSRRHPRFTSLHLLIRLATMSWIMPRLLPSVDMDLRRVSMASWLALPSSDSPFTAISWSFTLSLPSWEESKPSEDCWRVCKRDHFSLSLHHPNKNKKRKEKRSGGFKYNASSCCKLCLF